MQNKRKKRLQLNNEKVVKIMKTKLNHKISTPVLTLLALILFGTTATFAQTPTLRANGKIAFVRNSVGKSGIFVVNSYGSQQTFLINGEGIAYTFPSECLT